METTEWFQIEKGVHQGCILSPCLFNLYVEYIMWYARLDEAQAGIKIARRNINNLICAEDTSLIAESEEELKNLFFCFCFFKCYFFSFIFISWRLITSQHCSGFCHRKKESEKASLKLNIQKMKLMASSPITSWQIDGETMEMVRDFIS